MRVTKRTGGDLDQLFSACAKKTRVDDNNNAEQDTVAQPKKNYSMRRRTSIVSYVELSVAQEYKLEDLEKETNVNEMKPKSAVASNNINVNVKLAEGITEAIVIETDSSPLIKISRPTHLIEIKGRDIKPSTSDQPAIYQPVINKTKEELQTSNSTTTSSQVDLKSAATKLKKTAASKTSKPKATSKAAKVKAGNSKATEAEDSYKAVNTKLKKLGLQPKQVSGCIKAAMAQGHILLTGEPSDLEQLIIEDEFDGHEFKVHLKDILNQPDYGDDYDDGSESAPAVCSCCNEEDEDFNYKTHAYVTNICYGNPTLDSGKSHNHCNKCDGFGKCIGDYREAHCSKCKGHDFSGLSGFSCPNCKANRQKGKIGGRGRGGRGGGGRGRGRGGRGGLAYNLMMLNRYMFDF